MANISAKLKAYRAKRDFSKTGEPAGRLRVAQQNARRFVIQKHAASQLHYDFRLEIDGVLKSWAVTKGPSVSPSDKRLAVQVEDHPIDYGDFEGTIPKGQYGGGTVMLWDRGTWEATNEDPAKSLSKGELKFTLHGEKLHGGWVLVRMSRARSSRTSWLLIKHRDEFAGDVDVTEDDRSVASGRVMEDIEAGRGRGPKPFISKAASRASPRASWQSGKVMAKKSSSKRATGLKRRATTARAPRRRTSTKRVAKKRKVSEGEPPAFIAPQLCRLVDRPPSSDGWVHEVKFDGYRRQRIDAVYCSGSSLPGDALFHC